MVTSNDGRGWTERRVGMVRSFHDVAYGNDRFVATGGYFANPLTLRSSRSIIVTSTNGVAWAPASSPSSVQLYSIAFGQDLFVAAGVDYAPAPLRPAIYTSPDGRNWTSRVLPAGNSALWSVAYGDGRFVAVGGNLPVRQLQTRVYTSINGTNWIGVGGGTAFDVASVTFGDGKFVAVGFGGTIVVSADGTNWTARASSTGEFLSDITFSGGRFVAVGGAGTILTSTNGVTWSARTISGPAGESINVAHLFCVAYHEGVYLAGGTGGMLLSSPDAVEWRSRSVPTDRTLRGLASGQGNLVTVGDFGTILQLGLAEPMPAPATVVSALLSPAPFDLPNASTASSRGPSATGPVQKSSVAPSGANRINAITVRNDRAIQLSVTGTSAGMFRDYFSIVPVERSADLARWEPLAVLLRTNSLAGQPLFYLDERAAGHAVRFYRAAAGPYDTTVPTPTGPHRVGTFVRQLINPLNPLARPFMVSVWYPASPQAGSAPGPFMDPKIATLWASYGRNPALVRDSHAHAVPGAPVVEGTEKFPVIVYSPGQGSPRTDNTEKCEDLASHGFVVVALDARDSHSWVLDDGKVEFGDRWEALSLDFSSRVNDARFVLDQLPHWNLNDPLLAGRLDLESIGMFGFSFGGATATGVCQTDARIKAGAILDGGGHPDMAGIQLRIPFLITMAASDNHPFLPQWRTDYRALFDRLPANAYFVRFRSATHGSFGEFPWFTSPPNATQRRVATSIRAYVVAFFNKHLKSRDDRLLDGPPAAHPDVETFLKK